MHAGCTGRAGIASARERAAARPDASQETALQPLLRRMSSRGNVNSSRVHTARAQFLLAMPERVRMVRRQSEHFRLAARETADIRMRGRPGATSDHKARAAFARRAGQFRATEIVTGATARG